MGYEEYVEIRTGTLTINGQDVGNVKLFSHIPVKEVHEIISGLTKGVIDTKEFADYESMTGTCDRHTYERIAKMFGITSVLVVGTYDGRIFVPVEEFIVLGSYMAGNKTLLNYGRGSEIPINIEVIQLTMTVAGYTNCIPTDIGNLVTGNGGGSGHTGILMAYDNVNRIWLVQRAVHANQFADADNCTIGGGGTGVGIIAVDGRLPGGLWPDALQAGAEWVEGTDFNLGYHDGSVSRIAGGGMTDPDTVYGWYSYQNIASAILNFPKGDTQISTRAEYIYTHALANGKTQEIKIPDGFIVASPEIPHAPDVLTEYAFEIKSVEKASAVGAEHGYDKRIT